MVFLNGKSANNQIINNLAVPGNPSKTGLGNHEYSELQKKVNTPT